MGTATRQSTKRREGYPKQWEKLRKWQSAALSKDADRPQLQALIAGDGVDMAADGCRAHLIRTTSPQGEKDKGQLLAGVESMVTNAKDGDRITVTVAPIRAAAKQAAALRDEWDRKHHRQPTPLAFSCNGRLNMRAERAGVGDMSATFEHGDMWPARVMRKGRTEFLDYPIVYRHEDDSADLSVTTCFDVNPRYLLQAIAAWDDEDQIVILAGRTASGGEYIVIEPVETDRGLTDWPQAVIMCVHSNR